MSGPPLVNGASQLAMSQAHAQHMADQAAMEAEHYNNHIATYYDSNAHLQAQMAPGSAAMLGHGDHMGQMQQQQQQQMQQQQMQAHHQEMMAQMHQQHHMASHGHEYLHGHHVQHAMVDQSHVSAGEQAAVVTSAHDSVSAGSATPAASSAGAQSHSAGMLVSMPQHSSGVAPSMVSAPVQTSISSLATSTATIPMTSMAPTTGAATINVPLSTASAGMVGEVTSTPVSVPVGEVSVGIDHTGAPTHNVTMISTTNAPMATGADASGMAGIHTYHHSVPVGMHMNAGNMNMGGAQVASMAPVHGVASVQAGAHGMPNGGMAGVGHGAGVMVNQAGGMGHPGMGHPGMGAGGRTTSRQCRACGSTDHAYSTKHQCPQHPNYTGKKAGKAAGMADGKQAANPGGPAPQRKCRACGSTEHAYSTKHQCPAHPNYTGDKPRVQPLPGAIASAQARSRAQARGKGGQRQCRACGSTDHAYSTKHQCPQHPKFTGKRAGKGGDKSMMGGAGVGAGAGAAGVAQSTRHCRACGSHDHAYSTKHQCPSHPNYTGKAMPKGMSHMGGGQVQMMAPLHHPMGQMYHPQHMQHVPHMQHMQHMVQHPHHGGHVHPMQNHMMQVPVGATSQSLVALGAVSGSHVTGTQTLAVPTAHTAVTTAEAITAPPAMGHNHAAYSVGVASVPHGMESMHGMQHAMLPQQQQQQYYPQQQQQQQQPFFFSYPAASYAPMPSQNVYLEAPAAGQQKRHREDMTGSTAAVTVTTTPHHATGVHPAPAAQISGASMSHDMMHQPTTKRRRQAI